MNWMILIYWDCNFRPFLNVIFDNFTLQPSVYIVNDNNICEKEFEYWYSFQIFKFSNFLLLIPKNGDGDTVILLLYI